MVVLAFLIVSLVLLAVAAANVAAPKVSLGWLGLAFFVLASVWTALKLGG